VTAPSCWNWGRHSGVLGAVDGGSTKAVMGTEHWTLKLVSLVGHVAVGVVSRQRRHFEEASVSVWCPPTAVT
jgi:hypothetical protein